MRRILLNIAGAACTPAGWICALAAYLSPLKGVFYLILLIAVFDLATGLYASTRKHVPRTSRRLRKSVEKLFCYMGIIYLFWEFEKQVGIDGFVCTYKMVTGFIFLVEVISILENMAVITGHKTFTDIVRFIRGKAGRNDDVIRDIIKEKNDEDKQEV